MDFFLSKFLPLFFYPAGMITVLLVIMLLFWKKQRLVKTLCWLALVIIFLAGNRWVSMTIVHSLERQYAPMQSGTSADVIVVLGGGTEQQQYPREIVEVNGAGDRIIYALSLFKSHAADKMLLSGGTINWQGTRTTTPADDMAALLKLMGVPQDALILQGKSLNTEEDARYSAEIIREMGFSKVILVTSALHMPRSVKLFRAEGVEVIPAPTDFTLSDQEWRDLYSFQPEIVLINLIPTSANLKSTSISMKEYMGMLVNSLSR